MCIFCKIIAGEIPSAKVYEDDDVLAILDISQVTRGHTLVMPKKHFANILEADYETVSRCICTAKKRAGQITSATGAVGFNILTNCGETAGQTVGHLHFHIIPRYSSDDAIEIEFHPSEKQDLDEVLSQVKGG